MYDDGTFAFYSNSNKHGTMPASTAGRDDDGDDDDNENVILLCSLLLLQPLSLGSGWGQFQSKNWFSGCCLVPLLKCTY